MSLFIYTLRSIAGAVVASPLVLLLIFLMVILHFKNRKVVAMQKIILGGSVNSSVELTLSQLVLGIVGGCIGSLILTGVGVIFNDNSGIWYLFIISILLAFVKPRLICFSYSGAILGFISIVFRSLSTIEPQFSNIVGLNMDIFYLGTFIGVSHVIEGLLVMFDGDRGAIPVFTNRDGKILGGYALKRYWVLPIAVMIAVNMDNSVLSYATESILNPDWWPIIKSPSGLALLAGSVISISPFYTMLGYSSVTFTRSKREKALSSGMYISIYGIILIAVSQLAQFGILGEIFVLAFMPFTHELMLRLQVKSEEKRKPKFVSDDEGLVILEISTDSKVKEFGIDVESKVLSINDKTISSEGEAYPILKENLYNAVLKIKDSNGIVKEINFRHKRASRLGILLVPRNVNKEDIVPVENDSFKNVLSTIKNSSNKEKNKSNEKNDK